MWKNFNACEIRDDFSVIADLGMTLVRIFLLWQDFQPESPDEVDERALTNLEQVANIASEFNLKLDVTFFCGHMSGPNWMPNWLLLHPSSSSSSESARDAKQEQKDRFSNPHKLQVVIRNPKYSINNKCDEGGDKVLVLEAAAAPYRNPFHDEVAIRAQLLLIRKVVSRLASHAVVDLWNLGNEIDLVAFPRSQQEGVNWAEMMSNEIRKCDSTLHRKVTCGLHADSLRFSQNNLAVGGIFSKMDLRVMHAYPMYVAWLKDPLNSNFVPFSCVLTSILSSSSSSSTSSALCELSCYPPVLMEEFGGCTSHPGAPSQTWTWKSKNAGGVTRDRTQFMSSEEDYASYVSDVLKKLHFCGASGAVIWCFADYSSEIWQEPPCRENYHERYFGLVRPDGTLKPHALVLKEFAKSKLNVRRVAASADGGEDADEASLFQMYREVHESLQSGSRSVANWVEENSDEHGSNEASIERVFWHFQQTILPKYFSNENINSTS